MVALRTLVCTAARNLNGDTELQGPCGAARSVACKENRSGERDQGLFSPFSRSLFIMWISTSLAAAWNLLSPN